MRSRLLVSLFSALSLLALTSTAVLAAPWAERPIPRSVPEIATGGLVAAATLLAGGLAIARGRRRKS